MKRFLWLVLFPCVALGASSQGPYGIFGGPIPSANLAPAANVPANTYAFTTDLGLLIDNGSAWVAVAQSSISGANNTILCNNSGSTGNLTACTASATIGVLTSLTANFQTGSTYTLVLGDENNEVTMNSASANTLTIPANSSVAFPIGTIETIQQLGAGTTTIALAGGVSVQWGGSVTYASLGGQYGFEQFQKIATNVWQLVAQQLGDATFTVSGGTCSAATAAGGATGGTITLPGSGTVNACTIIITPGGGLTATNMWVGRMADQTQLTVPEWAQSAQNTTTITFTLPGAPAASDVLTFHIEAE